jgi:hypothetical protein
LTLAGNSERILFLNDRSGNVIENKGPLWKTRREAGMFLKRKHLALKGGNVVEKKSCYSSPGQKLAMASDKLSRTRRWSQSFPRKRESTPQAFQSPMSTGWIPAFAGMTGVSIQAGFSARE